MNIAMVRCKKMSARIYKIIVSQAGESEEAILICPIFKTKKKLTKRISEVEDSFKEKGYGVKFDQLWSAIISVDSKFPELF